MESKKFTEEQLEDFQEFLLVQMTGLYNMFDKRALAATGLSKERYFFVMENYSSLKEESEKCC